MTFYRRNLPHWHPEGKSIFITWRLYGSSFRWHQMASSTQTVKLGKFLPVLLS
jgi:hypothetical protein